MIDPIIIALFSTGGWFLFHAIIGYPDGEGYIEGGMIGARFGKNINKWSKTFGEDQINLSKPFWCPICGAVWATIIFIPIYAAVNGWDANYLWAFGAIPAWKNLIVSLER